MNVQDVKNKHFLKTITISIPKRIITKISLEAFTDPNSEIASFKDWVEALKIA
jgi:hypothetical protein